MVIEQVVGHRDAFLVPAFPVACLVSGDQHDRRSLWIECE
jgi:hypothetical protein